jgi:hypothetical protein
MRFNPDEYISVSERIEKFYAKFPQGRILTTVVEHSQETGFVLVRAEAYREPEDTLPAATGHAYELKSAGHVQAGSYVEVCETSAVGRALALLGFEVKRGVASREEVGRGQQKAQAPSQIKTAPGAPPVKAVQPAGYIDRDIMDALDILGKSEVELNNYVREKYGWGKDWTDMPPDRKSEVLTFLNSKKDKAVADARQ